MAGAMVEVAAMGTAGAMVEVTAIDPATVDAVVQLRLDRVDPEKWTSTPLRAVNNRQFADIAPLGKSRCGPGSLPS
jgi:hypothetical protein